MRVENNALTSANSIVSFALMAVALGPMLLLVRSTPDRIPADVVVEEQEKALQGKLAAIRDEEQGRGVKSSA
jgi:hypothetical protein